MAFLLLGRVDGVVGYGGWFCCHWVEWMVLLLLGGVDGVVG